MISINKINGVENLSVEEIGQRLSILLSMNILLGIYFACEYKGVEFKQSKYQYLLDFYRVDGIKEDK